jgi:hypothetical protein
MAISHFDCKFGQGHDKIMINYLLFLQLHDDLNCI